MTRMQPYWWQHHLPARTDPEDLMRQLEALIDEQETLIAQLREAQGRAYPPPVRDVERTAAPTPPPVIITQDGAVKWDTVVTLALLGWGLHSLLRGTPLPGDR